MSAPTYALRLTPAQARATLAHLAIVLNDPDSPDMLGEKDWRAFLSAYEGIPEKGGWTRLAGHQLRVLHKVLSIMFNDSDWPFEGAREVALVARAHDAITEEWLAACRSELRAACRSL